MEILFGNLIENCIKHARCDKIKGSGETEGDEYIVNVKDDGKGIDDDSKDKTFDKGFEKGDSGLGTYLIKEMADGYVGSVEIKDSELGEQGLMYI
ncbi:MAG: ATP-binding protein [Candidatus Thermoplasmatota archaeon]